MVALSCKQTVLSQIIADLCKTGNNIIRFLSLGSYGNLISQLQTLFSGIFCGNDNLIVIPGKSSLKYNIRIIHMGKVLRHCGNKRGAVYMTHLQTVIQIYLFDPTVRHHFLQKGFLCFGIDIDTAVRCLARNQIDKGIHIDNDISCHQSGKHQHKGKHQHGNAYGHIVPYP